MLRLETFQPHFRSLLARGTQGWRTVFIGALIGCLTLAAFWPMLGNGFIRYDDPDYVTGNPNVLGGLSWAGIAWAFRSGEAGNWHPITWLSHMADVQLFGLNPVGHHLTSLLLHTANSLLLFLLLLRMTGAQWRSAFVAALFALHPLHAESVAWVAERKDVLSTFFFLLTLLAYGAYVHSKVQTPKGILHEGNSLSARELRSRARPSRDRFFYLAALMLFALGLMCKPMLVTVPFVLLLLDFWPLARLEPGSESFRSQALRRILAEKLPFFLLALLSSIITFQVQQKGHAVTVTLPLSARFANAVASYWKYLGKAVWPTDLSIFYPHPDIRYPISNQWPMGVIVFAAVALLGISVGVAVGRNQVPWLTMGWFWYLGTLVPVIGIVQVGSQAMADRYTYIPLIGIFIVCVWGGERLVSRRKFGGAALSAFGGLTIMICLALTRQQVRCWHDNLAVFEHALSVTRHNAVAHCHVGIELGERRLFDMALVQFQSAIEDDPNCADGYYGLGFTLENLGRLQEATQQYRNALRVSPWHALARNRLAAVSSPGPDRKPVP